MGEVWKARDTRLGRSVAVKVSKTEFSERFEREARVVAALNHPNIATLYDVGPDYFVMEYVDGKPLQEVIPRKGLSVGESLKYATQIADALAAAHAAGIVHRDLKPGNVMITSSGQVKVVDFGLARMEAAPNADGHASLQTVEGTIAGTVAYMSPEQTQGQAVDARSDVFSFGALFYEMLAGARAFRGDSTAATLAEILTKEPPPIGNLPGDVEKLLNRCLRKEPGRRAQSMADVKAALLDLKEDSDSGRLYEALPGPQRGSPGSPRFGLWAAAGAAVLALAGLSVWLTHYASPAPPQTIVRLTTYPGSELYPSFSPDGNQVAFSWDGEQHGKLRYLHPTGGRRRAGAAHHRPGTGLLSGLVSGWPNHCLHTVSHRKPGGDSDSVHRRAGAQVARDHRKQRGVVLRLEMAGLRGWESRKPLPLFGDHWRAQALDDGSRGVSGG